MQAVIPPTSAEPYTCASSTSAPSFLPKTRARPGFEPGTSRTLSENHTPRPTSQPCTARSGNIPKNFADDMREGEYIRTEEGLAEKLVRAEIPFRLDS